MSKTRNSRQYLYWLCFKYRYFQIPSFESNHIMKTKDAEFFENIFLMDKQFVSSFTQETDKSQEREQDNLKTVGERG